MSIKSKVVAAAATLTLVGGVGGVGAEAALTAGTAGAATPSCDHRCIDIFSRHYRTHHHDPGFVMAVFRKGAKVGQPVILFRTSNSDPAEDFVASYQGRVSALGPGGARLVSASVLLHYGRGCKFFNTKTLTCTKYFPDDFAYQIQYAPYGVHTGLCVGTAATAANGTKVSLRPCSVSGKTIWIVDIANSTGHSFLNLYVPLINGSQTNFADPFVLTYPQKSSPTDMPRPQLATENLQYIPHHGGVIPNQQWGADRGALQ